MSIKAMKQARQIIWRYRHETPLGNQPHMIAHQADEILERIDQAIAEAEKQEPVAWQERHAKRMKDGLVTEWTNWYPCRYRTIDEAREEASDHIPYEWHPLYTHPQPNREWVGLTWQDLPNENFGNIDFCRGANWAEAKLKQKNGYAEEKNT